MMFTDAALIKKEEQFHKLYMNLHQSIRAHGNHVGILTGILAKPYERQITRQYQLADNVFETAILSGGNYHDIGKYLIGKHLFTFPLNKKAGFLSNTELEVVHRHPVYTAKLLEEYAEVLFKTPGEKQLALDMGLFHHERYDGGGYPKGLKGEEIPLIAQLCALANMLDNSICTGRLNKPFDPAAERVIQGSGSWFSPEVVDCFRRSMNMVRELYETKGVRTRRFG